jgi:hypothetical protein
LALESGAGFAVRAGFAVAVAGDPGVFVDTPVFDDFAGGVGVLFDPFVLGGVAVPGLGFALVGFAGLVLVVEPGVWVVVPEGGVGVEPEGEGGVDWARTSPAEKTEPRASNWSDFMVCSTPFNSAFSINSRAANRENCPARFLNLRSNLTR